QGTPRRRFGWCLNRLVSKAASRSTLPPRSKLRHRSIFPGLFFLPTLLRLNSIRSLLEQFDHRQDDERDAREHNRHRVSSDVIAIVERPENVERRSFGEAAHA